MMLGQSGGQQPRRERATGPGRRVDKVSQSEASVTIWTGGRADTGWRWTATIPHPNGRGDLFVGESTRAFDSRDEARADYDRWRSERHTSRGPSA